MTQSGGQIQAQQAQTAGPTHRKPGIDEQPGQSIGRRYYRRLIPTAQAPVCIQRPITSGVVAHACGLGQHFGECRHIPQA